MSMGNLSFFNCLTRLILCDNPFGTPELIEYQNAFKEVLFYIGIYLFDIILVYSYHTRILYIVGLGVIIICNPATAATVAAYYSN